MNLIFHILHQSSWNRWDAILFLQKIYVLDQNTLKEKEKPPQAVIPFEEAFAKGGNSDKVRLIPSHKIS
jgi:hypothetical protein